VEASGRHEPLIDRIQERVARRGPEPYLRPSTKISNWEGLGLGALSVEAIDQKKYNKQRRCARNTPGCQQGGLQRHPPIAVSSGRRAGPCSWPRVTVRACTGSGNGPDTHARY
jgi:hypothetical protein